MEASGRSFSAALAIFRDCSADGREFRWFSSGLVKKFDVLSVAASCVAAVRGNIWDFRMIRMSGNCCSRILQFFFCFNV